MNTNQEIQTREDFIDEDQEEYHEEAKLAVISLGIPEDEADNFLEDIGI